VHFAADSSGGGNILYTIAPIALIFVAIYFLMLRPQNKKRRDAAQMQSTLGPGDEVQTVDGMFGTVSAVTGDEVRIEAAPGVELRFARGAIARVVNKIADENEDEDEAGDEEDETEGTDSTAKAVEQH
jgi:preprotein translocase subunit YajC